LEKTLNIKMVRKAASYLPLLNKFITGICSEHFTRSTDIQRQAGTDNRNSANRQSTLDGLNANSFSAVTHIQTDRLLQLISKPLHLRKQHDCRVIGLRQIRGQLPHSKAQAVLLRHRIPYHKSFALQ